MMTNKCSRLIAYRWFMTDAYQTCCFQLKIYPFLLVDTENCFSFETECDFMLSYWSSLGIVLRVTKTFSVSSWKVHFPLWYCTLVQYSRSILGSVNLSRTFWQISEVWDTAQTLNMQKFFSLFFFYIIPPSWLYHQMVFDIFYLFYCVSLKRIYFFCSVRSQHSLGCFYLQGSSFWLQLSFGNFVPLPVYFLFPPTAAPGSLMMSYDLFFINNTIVRRVLFIMGPCKILVLLMGVRFLLLTSDMGYHKVNFIHVAWNFGGFW